MTPHFQPHEPEIKPAASPLRDESLARCDEAMQRRIIALAGQLQDRERTTLTVAQLEAAAAEAGLDPRFVREAARELHPELQEPAQSSAAWQAWQNYNPQTYADMHATIPLFLNASAPAQEQALELIRSGDWKAAARQLRERRDYKWRRRLAVCMNIVAGIGVVGGIATENTMLAWWVPLTFFAVAIVGLMASPSYSIKGLLNGMRLMRSLNPRRSGAMGMPAAPTAASATPPTGNVPE